MKLRKISALCLLALVLASPVLGSWYYGAGVTTPCDSVNDASLMAYWRLDEASGTRLDTKGVNHLFDSNTVASATGKIGDAGDFESSASEYLQCLDNAALSTGPGVSFTVGGWFRLESTNASLVVLSKDLQTSGTREFQLYYDAAGRRFSFAVGRTGSSTLDTASSNVGFQTNTWYHIVCYYDTAADVVGIATDGGTANTTAKTIDPPDSTVAFQLGRSVGTYWDGLADEVFFTKRVLTAGERTALYAAGVGCRPTGL